MWAMRMNLEVPVSVSSIQTPLESPFFAIPEVLVNGVCFRSVYH